MWYLSLTNNTRVIIYYSNMSILQDIGFVPFVKACWRIDILQFKTIPANTILKCAQSNLYIFIRSIFRSCLLCMIRLIRLIKLTKFWRWIYLLHWKLFLLTKFKNVLNQISTSVHSFHFPQLFFTWLGSSDWLNWLNFADEFICYTENHFY